MYFKIALKNVRKSYSDYFVYFLTLSISVALFYLFNSFEAQQSILVSDPEIVFAFRTLAIAMEVLSYIVTVVFGFLIIYANNFLMKRRKKEIALYTLLGMKKRLVSRILVYETLIVGALSLVFGLASGILLSQVTAAFSGYILEVDMLYRFFISDFAIRSTIFSFALIFGIVGIFNSLVLRNTRLIDLFKARSKNEEIIIKNPILMTIIMIIAILGLGFAYYLALDSDLFLKLFFPIVILGSLSTLGIFYALSYWLIRIISLMKNYYHKDINAFTIRQVGSKISSTYKMLTVISLLLLVAFGGIATAFNMVEISTSMLYDQTSSDFTLAADLIDQSDDTIDKIFVHDDLEVDKSIVHYTLEDSTNPIFANLEYYKDFYARIMAITLKDYNELRVFNDLKEITLADNEIALYSALNQGNINKQLEELGGQDIDIFEKSFKVTEAKDVFLSISGVSLYNDIIVVMDEKDLQTIELEAVANGKHQNQIYNINFKDGVVPAEGNQLVFDLYNSEDLSEIVNYIGYGSRLDLKNSMKESTLLFTYLGLYLGLTFLIVSVMVISLQLMSEASDNYDRYLLLDKIGVSEKLQKKSILKHSLIYFALPLLLALVHSFVGIQAVNNVIGNFGLTNDSIKMILISVGILVLIYIIYFFITYLSSQRIIFTRK